MDGFKSKIQIGTTRFSWCISSIRKEAILSNMDIIIIGEKMKLLWESYITGIQSLPEQLALEGFFVDLW